MGRRTKKNKLLLRSIVISLAVILVVAWLWLILWPLWSALMKPDNTVRSSVNQTQTLTNQPEYFASFSDLFSGTAWLDQQQTDLTRDPSAMVLTFKPNIEWQPLGDCVELASRCQAVNPKPVVQQSCLGQNCLVIKDNQLSYQKRLLVLPVLEKGEMVNLTANLFADRWLVAGVQKIAEKQYQPLAWWFDGRDFVAINLVDDLGRPAKSQYLGKLAIAGQSDNVLILYSAYDGLAWQVNGAEVRSLSHFFGIRVNNGGFLPQIINLGQGKDTVWYVFDQSGQQARLLKFWQNKTDWIEGSLDLSADLPATSQAIYLVADIKNSSKNDQRLIAKTISGEGKSQLWSLVDHGFIAPAIGQATSVNLNTYDRMKPQIVGALIASATGGWSGLISQWSLSVDGLNWQSVQLGQRLNFQPPVNQLWWRWQVLPGTDVTQSPCLKMITINYYRL